MIMDTVAAVTSKRTTAAATKPPTTPATTAVKNFKFSWISFCQT